MRLQRVERLLRRVQTFGFHLVPLDVRPLAVARHLFTEVPFVVVHILCPMCAHCVAALLFALALPEVREPAIAVHHVLTRAYERLGAAIARKPTAPMALPPRRSVLSEGIVATARGSGIPIHHRTRRARGPADARDTH